MIKINSYGIITIIFLHLKIFLKEFQYTIVSPLISSLVFIIILATTTNLYSLTVDDLPFLDFIIPGVIMMVVIQETYSNISESLINMKINGSFNDILSAPINRYEIAISFIFSTLLIGVFSSLINLLIINIFIDAAVYNFFRFIYYISITSLIIGSFGAIIGFVSYKWDTQQSFFIFFITPISMFSGIFFSINIITSEWKFLFSINPFYHLTSNFRKSFYINNFYDLTLDMILMFICFISIYISIFIFKKGYRVIF